MWFWSLGQQDPLEKGKATHSSIPAWRIPWTEEPGGLQSTGSRRVGHDWSDTARMGLSCGMWNWDLVPWPGVEPGPLHCDLGVSDTGSPGESPEPHSVYRWGWSLCGSPRPPAVRSILKTITKSEHPYLHHEGCDSGELKSHFYLKILTEQLG